MPPGRWRPASSNVAPPSVVRKMIPSRAYNGPIVCIGKRHPTKIVAVVDVLLRPGAPEILPQDGSVGLRRPGVRDR